MKKNLITVSCNNGQKKFSLNGFLIVFIFFLFFSLFYFYFIFLYF